MPPAAAQAFLHMVAAVSACVETRVLEGDPEELALGLWSAVHGCVSLLIAQPSFPWPRDREALIDHIVRLAGFGAAVYSRLPRRIPPSAELAARLDDFGARLAATGEEPAVAGRRGRSSAVADRR
ncbi:TetR-like C-terminal domain-containing protein [Nonomuraea antimicrobica]